MSSDVGEGTIAGLIWSERCRKSTPFSMIAGVQRPASRRSSFNGKDVTGRHRVAAAGVSRTCQLVRVFGLMTVLENLTTAAHPRHRSKSPASRHPTHVDRARQTLGQRLRDQPPGCR